ncbi:hypothetical protein PI126_g12799 [Phytophthora idaei]|nr:hypothetical protein PI126_g12799 [Phytophthora idaei]
MMAEDVTGVATSPSPRNPTSRRPPVRITHALEQSEDWVTTDRSSREDSDDENESYLREYYLRVRVERKDVTTMVSLTYYIPREPC